MALSNHHPHNYPYQQSSAQHYPAYQTAPASSRQYQPALPVVTTQATDYMSYSAQSYGGQGSAYGGAQDTSWEGSSYGDNRESTNRAAEVLRNTSSTNYTFNPSPAVSQPTFTAANSAVSSSARYSSSAGQAQHTHQSHQPHASHSYGPSQARPRSVNTNRTQTSTPNRELPSPVYPAQRTQNAYNQQQKRPTSPAQRQYAPSTATTVTSARSVAMMAATQYSDYSSRQLPNVDAVRNAQSTAVTGSFSHADNQTTAPIAQSIPAANVLEPYHQGTITVDPSAVYNPWPEYQQAQEALRAKKAVEDAARAEEERLAEEAKEEERKEEEEEEEEAEKVKQSQAAKQKGKKAHKQQVVGSVATSSSVIGASDLSSDTSASLEAEIRAMMAKMRELNGKDPALLARIWEEERRTKTPKSPTVQTKPPPQPAAAQSNTPQTANQSKKAAPKEATIAAAAKPATPIPAQAVVTKLSTRPGGNTIWPPEKKAQLANAAATYLNGQNQNNQLDAERILRMLDSNPSYIELCEQLETAGLKLDRAVFAKTLLTAVPDVNSASRKAAPQPASQATVLAAQRVPPAPPAIMKRDIGTPTALSPVPAAASPTSRAPHLSFPNNNNNVTTSHSPVPIAEMLPTKPELKPPANKEEAARKRNFNDLIDLTQFSEEEDLAPRPKRTQVGSMHSYGSPAPRFDDPMDIDAEAQPRNNFPTPASVPTLPIQESTPAPAPAPPVSELRYRTIVEPLDRKKALRRNTYNIKTIARDVLLACGRHPETRQLNQHLDTLKATLPQITSDSDLSTLRWDLIDPGRPPPGYFKDGAQTLAEDADDEGDSSGDEGDGSAVRGRPTESIGGEGATATRTQPLPDAINPFKPRKRGRPPRHSYPNSFSPSTPQRASASSSMSTSVSHPTTSGVGYSAFRSTTEYDADGKPLPKKKGRPVGWRKAIHGSAAAQARPSANGHTGPYKHIPSQPSALRNVRTGGNEPIRIESRSPSVSHRAPQYQTFKCKWQNCQAELHNLETLRKHVYKVHRKETSRGSLECLWDHCGTHVTGHHLVTNMMIEQHSPSSFIDESEWRSHIQKNHFDPLSWEQGDGPASGLSDAQDSESYLSDAQGRRVTPHLTSNVERYGNDCEHGARASHVNPLAAPRGRGRPPKNNQEQEARHVQERLISQKKRIGGPGIDRGGATLVNEKRRKGFSDNDETEEELVDVED